MDDVPPGAPPGGRFLTWRLVMVLASTMAYFVALSVLLPVLPRYVEDDLGGGGAEVGLAVGAFAVSAALLRPLAGRLGDSHGRRVLVVGGSLVFALSVVGYTAASTLALLVVLRLMSGIGEAGVWVGAATAVQDMAPAHRRGEAASYFSISLYGGLAAGPPLGEWMLAEHGFDAVFVMAAASALAAMLLGLATPVGHTRAGAGGPAGDVQPKRGLLHRGALGPGVVLGLGLVPFVGFATFLPIYGEDVRVDDIGVVFLVYALLVMSIRVLGARLPDLLGWRLASTIALTSVGTGAALLALWPDEAGVWVAAISLAVGMALLFPALFTAAVVSASEDERSHAVGTFSVFFDLANGVGALALGVVVGLTSERGGFAASALAAAAGLAVLPAVIRRQQAAAATLEPR